MELLLIRHGRPDRVDHDPNGANPGLTELGVRQAARMAEYLAPESLDAIYVSPQQRAIETAHPLEKSKGIEAVVVDDIAEFDLGQPSYIPGEEAGPLTADELEDLLSQLTSATFVERVLSGISSIVGAHPSQRVAAVCHGGVISTVLTNALDVAPGTYFDSHYTSITRIKASRDGRWTMASFNECPWLREM